MNNICLNDFFKQNGINIKVYLAKETIQDPYEKNVELTYLNPLPIKVLAYDLTATQANWKMPSVIVSKAKEIITHKKYRSLLEQSQKIEVDGDFYEGWRVNGRMQIREDGNFLRIYIYTKQV